jgi:hypothetical protein
MIKGGTAAVLGFAVLVLALVILGPLITIWAINTLFPVLAIPYTFWTWLAVIILFSAVRTNVSYKR